MKNWALMLAVSANIAIAETEAPAMSMGNGDNNWIVTEGATREGSNFVFPKVRIAGAGWLVMHPFKDGKPNGKVVAGYAGVPDGVSENVSITVDQAPTAGAPYIVMLHSDANQNGRFDFVFVSEREVVDAAVFEGSTMIGHVYVTP